MNQIHNFNDFLTELYQAGMSVGGENNESVFSLCDYFGEEICWHTEVADTDPWEWRMRVLHEKEDIAYGKYFFKKSGFITREWFPYFYAIRRGRMTLEEAYEAGTISHYAKQIYELIEEYKELPLHLIKQYGGFTKEDKSKFDRAITELQMGFFITMSGRARKISNAGEEYGWSSTVFCLVEDFWGEVLIRQAEEIDREVAYNKIWDQIYRLNPKANEKKVKKFIEG
ncbi:AlkZ-related protein [Anaerosporobacter sp.]